MWAVKKLARQSVMSSPLSLSSFSPLSPPHRRVSTPSFLSACLLASALLLTHLISPSSSSACGKDDWMYSYTECDSAGMRWRVAVPKNTEADQPCEILKSPVQGKSCSFSCPAGKYMAVQGDQECHGEIMMGNGISVQNILKGQWGRF